jgi:nitroreductase
VYNPETNSILVHEPSINKTTIAPNLDQSWMINGNIILVVAWNQTKMNNSLYALTEAGCLAQNVYLAALTLNLGTTVATSIHYDELHDSLNLDDALVPLLILPLGIPSISIEPASPDYDRMTGNLPQVEYSLKSFEEALVNQNYSETWSETNLSSQQISNLLWASYGYSNTTHRTTPSAVGVYPLKILVLNTTGAYEYSPEDHSVSTKLSGDFRDEIAEACGNQAWAAEASALFLITYDSTYNVDWSSLDFPYSHQWQSINMGCVLQSLLLEAATLDLAVNTLSQGFDEWNGPTAGTIRTTLTLSVEEIPLFVIPIGTKSTTPSPTSSPSPTPSPTSSPSPTPSPTSSPSPTPTTSPTPTPTTSPSPTLSPSPTPSPSPGEFWKIEYTYALILGLVIGIIAIIVFVVIKRR